MAARERPYSVGEVARVVGISASTLRSWERQGLLDTARTASGHRRFSTADIARLRRIRDLRDADGLPVALIRRRLGEQARRREPGRTKPAVDTMAGGRAAGRGGVAIRLRGARTGRGLSLRALAAAAGVSASYVSALERGHAQPSIATLQKLTAALGTTVTSLVSPPLPSCTVVRQGRADLLDIRVPGVRIANLAPTASALEPQLFTLAPGAGSGGDYRHEGEEFLFVIDGLLSITLDSSEHYEMQAGDSMCFASTRAHRWRNPGDTDARVLWINTPPTF